jgi:K+:H+ antiporter
VGTHDHLLLQLASMLGVALLGGLAARAVRLPSVIGELVAGILIGPTVLGWWMPGVQAWVFPPGSAPGRDAVLRLGMICFLFVAGLEVDLRRLRRMGRAVAATGLLGVLVPFCLGYGAVIIAPGLWRPHATAALPFLPTLVGTALSITALPVIARVLIELGLAGGEVGTLVLSAAALNDLVGWFLFSFVLSLSGPGEGRSPAFALGVVAGVGALLLIVGRAVALRVRRRLRRLSPGSLIPIAIAACATLLGAAGGEALGLHGVLGAFLAGVAVAPADGTRTAARDAAYQFALGVFAPLFFASVGLQIDLRHHFDPVLCAVVLLLACGGKILGATLGARLGGLPGRASWAVGFGMNARGAMEIVLASVAREHGLIDDELFAALVLMALITSLTSGPAMARLAGYGRVRARSM